jgi:hypothetical protein
MRRRSKTTIQTRPSRIQNSTSQQTRILTKIDRQNLSTIVDETKLTTKDTSDKNLEKESISLLPK